MKIELSPYCRRPAWLIPIVTLLLSFLVVVHASARVGETREEMIQRLGEPESKGKVFTCFKLGDIFLMARFEKDVCVEEEYDITNLEAKKRERLNRIESLLSDASGGKSWEIVDLSGAGVKWSTEDGALSAELQCEEESGGSRDDYYTTTAEYLTVTSNAFQAAEIERIRKNTEASERNYPNPFLRIVILLILGFVALSLLLHERHKLSAILGAFILAANPFVPLPKVPIVYGGILLTGCVGVVLLILIGRIRTRSEKLKAARLREQ